MEVINMAGMGTQFKQRVFGTDWPAMPKSVKFNADRIAELGLSSTALQRTFYENAARILKV